LASAFSGVADASIRIDRAKQCLKATLEEGEPMTLVVSGTSHQLSPDQALRVSVGRLDRWKAPLGKSPAVDHMAH
jgi:hypothetical protein